MSNSENIMVAVDDGFAYTKAAMLDEGGRIVTWGAPTCVSPGVKAITSFSGADTVHVYEVDGIYFTVGNLMEQEDTRYDDYPFSPQNAAMVHHILYSGGHVPEGTTVNLAASVPMALFYDSPASRQAVIDRRRQSLTRQVVRQGAPAPYRIANVSILPEAASSYVDFVVDDAGKNRFSVLPQMAIVDIGGRTTDIAVMVDGTSIDRTRSGTEQLGVLDLLSDVAQRVQGEVSVRLGKPAPVLVPLRIAESIIMDFARTGKAQVNLFGRGFDVTEQVSSAVTSFVRHVYSRCQRRIEDISAQMDAVLVTGGGALLTKESFCEVYPHVVVPDEAQYSNVRGMLKYMLYLA